MFSLPPLPQLFPSPLYAPTTPPPLFSFRYRWASYGDQSVKVYQISIRTGSFSCVKAGWDNSAGEMGPKSRHLSQRKPLLSTLGVSQKDYGGLLNVFCKFWRLWRPHNGSLFSLCLQVRVSASSASLPFLLRDHRWESWDWLLTLLPQRSHLDLDQRILPSQRHQQHPLCQQVCLISRPRVSGMEK